MNDTARAIKSYPRGLNLQRSAGALHTQILRLLREPLLWFFLVGGLCYALYAIFGQTRTPIIVSAADRRQLSEDYRYLNGREPDAAQVEQLVRDYVNDEILFHEALRRDLLINDGKTRERMVDKMRYLLAERPGEPTEADLLDFYSRHRDWYTSGYQLNFDHIFFEQLPGDPAGLLARLEAGKSIAGDEFWLGRNVDGYSEGMLRGMLGDSFVDSMHKMTDGHWHGPLRSSRGFHYVRVRSISEPKLIPYAQMREQVKQDWSAEQRERSVSTKLDEVRDRYDIKIIP